METLEKYGIDYDEIERSYTALKDFPRIPWAVVVDDPQTFFEDLAYKAELKSNTQKGAEALGKKLQCAGHAVSCTLKAGNPCLGNRPLRYDGSSVVILGDVADSEAVATMQVLSIAFSEISSEKRRMLMPIGSQAYTVYSAVAAGSPVLIVLS